MDYVARLKQTDEVIFVQKSSASRAMSTTEQAALTNSSAQVANKETNAATEGQDLWRQLLTDSTTTRDAIAQKHLSLLGMYIYCSYIYSRPKLQLIIKL
jgi:hypothetical protein